MNDILAGDPAPTNPTAREQLFRRVAGAFVDEAKANALLDAYRAEVLTEAADRAEELRQFDAAWGARKAAQVSENVGILRVADELRRMAEDGAR